MAFELKERKKKTRVVCTIGPASEDEKMLRKLILAGMNVMRLNFSHGDFEEHGGRIKTVRKLSKELNKNIAILLDTKGPEIRTGDFVGGKTEFKKGQVVTICQEDIEGTSDRFTITYKELYKDVKPGGFILVNDGQVELLVDHVEGTDIVCVCANDGIVKNKRGINVPGVKLGFDYLSPKDTADITFGCEQGVNFIAASFVRRAQDVLDVKKLLIENGHPEIQIIAKIENNEGVDNMDEILKVADGIMVARGDLGVEVPAEDVPLIQKKLIKKCRAAGKVVITATHPEESVMTMTKIALKTEETLDYASLLRKAIRTAPEDPSEAICMSVAEIASKFKVSAIVVYTESGSTAKRVSRYRPESMIIAATPYEPVTRSLALNWGVKGVVCKRMNDRASQLEYAQILAKENGVEPGEQILITAGTPGVGGTTSYLELVTVK